MSNIKKKIVAMIIGLSMVAMMAPGLAQALTVDELQVQINALLAQLATLQAQLTALTGAPAVTGCTVTSFDRNLKLGMTGDDVKCLQIILNSDAATQVAATGAGSPGNETTYFGALTKAAVIKFQEKYAADVLTPLGLTAGTGFVGTKTIAKLNSILTAGVVVTPPTEEVTPVAEGLTAALNAATPAATVVPANATAAANNVPFTKVDFTAGGSEVTITGIKVTRTGLSQDAAISSIKLFDGTLQVGTSQSLGSDHKANFTNISIKVSANTTKTITLAATLAQVATYSGNIIQLGIAAASDITASITPSGTFPITGNAITLTSSVTIGTATLYNGADGTRNTSDLTVDPSEVDIRLTQVKIEAGSAEGLKITQITAVKNGTAATADVKDIKLTNDTAGTTLATVASLNENGRAVFSNLNVEVAKGGYVELSVKATLVSGSGRTIAFDLHDGVAYTIDITGATYGFGITPTRSNFCAAAGTCTAQTINQGYLTVSKSSKTPATGYIALGGSGIELAAFDFVAGGEGVNVTKTSITITPASGGSAVDYTNVTGYDDSGKISFFGPQDGTTTTADTAQTLAFTDAYTVPVGTTTIHIKANISSSSVAGEKVTVSIPIGSTTDGITAKGAISGKTTYTTSSGSTIPPGTSAVSGNQMTILGPALQVITASVPITATIVAGSQDAVFAYFDFNATASGEDVKVTTIVVQDTKGASAVYTDLINLELYDASTRLETTNSTATNAATVTFSLKTPLKASAGLTKRLTLKADVISSATTGATAAYAHTYNIDGTTATVTSVGWGTGSGITETYTGNGQAQILGSKGTLQITVSADRSAAVQFVAGTTGNSTMEYKLYANNEDIDVSAFYVATEGTGSGANVAKVKLYLDGVALGNPAGYTLDAANNGKTLISLSSGMLRVPKSTYKTLTIKVDLVDKISLTDAATLEVGLGDTDGDNGDWGANGAASAASKNYYMSATGVSSGSTITNDGSTGWINSTAATGGTIAASFTQYLYDGVLVASLASGSPSGSQTAGAGKEVMRVDLQAVGDDITINEMEFCVAGTATVSGTGSLTIKSFDLGTTYATVTSGDFDTYWDTVLSTSNTNIILDPTPTNANAYCFSVGDDVGTTATKDIVAFSTTLNIATGTAKTIRLFGDTTGALTTLSIQLTLGPHSSSTYRATTSGIEWENNTGTDVDSTLTKNLPVTGGSLTY